MRRRGLRILGFTAAGLAALAVAAWAVWPAPPPATDWAGLYDVAARPPGAIAPGTVVDRGPPAGWSHLVIKSNPRVRADKVAGLNPQAVRKAGWMCTMFAADVRPTGEAGPTAHAFRAVGLGLGTAVDGRDTVLTPDTVDRFGVKFESFFDRTISLQILSKGYEVQGQAVMPVHSPGLGLLDTPVIVHRGGTNRQVRYRYTLLVDRPTGRLDVLLWLLDPAEPARAVRIGPNTLDPAELVPDPTQFGPLGIPTEYGFGVEALPPHTGTFPFPPDLRPVAYQTRFTPADAHALEAGLRRLLAPSP